MLLGPTLSGDAVVWPETMAPLAGRLGYITSAGVYLPADIATGMTITITAGTAAVFAGMPDVALHRMLTMLSTDQSYVITGLAAGEIISVQSNQGTFAYVLTMPDGTPVPPHRNGRYT